MFVFKPPFHPIGKERFLPWGYGDGQTHDNWTDETDSSLLVTNTHSPGWRTPKTIKGQREIIFGNRAVGDTLVPEER